MSWPVRPNDRVCPPFRVAQTFLEHAAWCLGMNSSHPCCLMAFVHSLKDKSWVCKLTAVAINLVITQGPRNRAVGPPHMKVHSRSECFPF